MSHPVQGRAYYDKNCPFCCRLARWGQRLFASSAIEWIPADYTDLAQLPVAVDAMIYAEGEQYWIKSEALRRLLKRAGHPVLAGMMALIPLRWRDWLYDQVAAKRYCIGNACPSPSKKP